MLTSKLIQDFTEGHTGRFFFLEDAAKLCHRFLLLAGGRGKSLAGNSCMSCDFAVHPCRAIAMQATSR
jgi:hypothetical protein